MNIAVLFGGISPERNVSITGGKAVCKALKSLGHNVIPIDPALGINCTVDIESLEIPIQAPTLEELSKYPTRNIIQAINSDVFDTVDVAFLVLHGVNGEDGKVQALLELRGIPYTGSDVKSSAISIDKNAAKMIFHASRLTTPPWTVLRHSDIGNYDTLEILRDDLGNHLVVKPNNQGSSIGVEIIDSGNLDDINNALIKALQYSDIALIERFIPGRELTVGLLGGEALPIIEIMPNDGFYDYTNKYSKGRSNYICPADVTPDIDEFTRGMAETAFLELGCSGFARADFRLSDDNQPFLIEMNTIPGFTATSLVPMAAAELGIEFPDLCMQIIELALNNNNHHPLI